MERVSSIQSLHGEEVKCTTFVFGKLLLSLFSLSRNWNKKVKDIKYPIWIDKKALYIFRVAVNLKFQK